MRVLILHNYYQRWGGADQVAEQEMGLLEQYEHNVRLYSRHNDEIKDFSAFRKGLLFFEPTWSFRSYREIKKIIADFQPEVAHFHNTFPLISPSAYYACANNDVPIVQTLHDYRLLCPIGLFYRDDEVCEDCLHRSLWRSIWHACYHDSSTQTASVAMLLKSHRILGTWRNKIDKYVALTEFARRKMIEGDIPAEKVVVRSNFLTKDPGYRKIEREYGLFVGRLSPEKGLKTLLEAWLTLSEVKLKIIGNGPMRSWIEAYIDQYKLDQIQIMGFQTVETVLEEMRRARFLIMPSLCYEGLPRTIVEAFAVGTPVIASDLGSLSSLIEHERTGLLFTPGDSSELAAKISSANARPTDLHEWGERAREVFEREYTPEVAHKRLIDIYEQVI